MKYETIIGLEIHAQLLTESKMFCACSSKFSTKPNSNICPICTGQPGSLPIINKKAVEFAIKTALALNCKINDKSVFARKNYFYPDLPKGYQISQFELPLAEKGYLEIDLNGQIKRINITRVHLEEDAGKLVHKGSTGLKGSDYSLVDLNRAGTPLMEIVSEPDLRNPQEAKVFMEELAHLLEYLKVCDAKLEEGSLRCDANISLRPLGENKFGTKTELKNMNSFKAVQKALEEEVKRQEEILVSGGKISQQSLLYDESTGKISPMRNKEESNDYRYFPDPDLPPLEVKKEWIEEIKKSIPELPIEKWKRLIAHYKIPAQDADVLVSSQEIAEFFEESVKLLDEPKQLSNWLIGDISAYLNLKNTPLSKTRLTPDLLVEMVRLINGGSITGKTAKDVLIKIIETGKSAAELVKESGSTQINDEASLLDIVKKIISQNEASVNSYKSGKETAIKFLIGQAMKETKGRGNPQMLEKLLKDQLSNS